MVCPGADSSCNIRTGRKHYSLRGRRHYFVQDRSDRCADARDFDPDNCRWLAIEVGLTRTYVGNLDRVLCFDGFLRRALRTDPEQSPGLYSLHEGSRRTVECIDAEGLFLAALPSAVTSLAKLVAFCSIARNTASRSPGELLMTCSTSDVRVCCCNASFSSRMNRAIFASWSTAEELQRRTAFGALPGRGVTVLPRRVLTGLLRALERGRIASPQA
jgi:hypothetical protein